MTISQPLENETSSLPVEFFNNNHGKAYQVALDKFEKPLLNAVLIQTRGNQTEAAEVLGINRGTLRKKLQHHKILK
ncbi:helix-turn-helix domain-containing protein [Acinetobacter pittii]|uniref:helix-turn-helix domain-containing protein n=1 Tax=Acinetobacter calcoaceticus/baumannii complex TaxID=909768 RepID=UPI00083859F6|nr:helix-turn-helix domain-containing protein [Acinetobacter pittii]OCY90871.1 protein ninH [Acinetobacter pittii]RSO48447.1 protein ninH [Acinetobacter pittii]RSO77837.1 protein ninH [Acinetobacter pittii]